MRNLPSTIKKHGRKPANKSAYSRETIPQNYSSRAMVQGLAKYFDHTNATKPIATEKDIRKTCEEAKKYGFFSVCVNPCYVKFVKKILKNSGVKVCSVVGFPLGANTTETKVFETKQAIKNGADEIDMVINIGAMKGKKYRFVEKDIQEVVKAARDRVVKVIIECCYLTNREKKKACEIAKRAGAHFVKTSTTLGTGGATIEDVKLMKKAFGGDVHPVRCSLSNGVKAAGGIRTLDQVRQFIKAGASRIGASESVEIMKELEKNNFRTIMKART